MIPSRSTKQHSKMTPCLTLPQREWVSTNLFIVLSSEKQIRQLKTLGKDAKGTVLTYFHFSISNGNKVQAKLFQIQGYAKLPICQESNKMAFFISVLQNKDCLQPFTHNLKKQVKVLRIILSSKYHLKKVPETKKQMEQLVNYK